VGIYDKLFVLARISEKLLLGFASISYVSVVLSSLYLFTYLYCFMRWFVGCVGSVGFSGLSLCVSGAASCEWKAGTDSVYEIGGERGWKYSCGSQQVFLAAKFRWVQQSRPK